MDVIIVSKTHMTNAACVGGISGSGKFVRLLNENGYNQDVDTKLKIGDVWTIEYNDRPNKIPPHIEDILVTKMTFKFSFDSEKKMVEYLKTKLKIKIWSGSPDVLFDGKLNWTDSGSGFINKENGISENSVGFWISNQPLRRKILSGQREDGSNWESTRYNYPNINGWRNLPYVGFEDAIEIIPAGTLIRVSLARWWDTNGKTEERCSLQLSGWYDLPKSQKEVKKDVEPDDLPF